MILHPQLQQDCIILGRFELCLVLLMNDKQYPWLILVPQRENIREIFDLCEADQHLLMQESNQLSKMLSILFNADKMNIAALGNIVPQLHIHHIVRFNDDPAWPAPVWGRMPAIAYSPEERSDVCAYLQSNLPLQAAL